MTVNRHQNRFIDHQKVHVAGPKSALVAVYWRRNINRNKSVRRSIELGQLGQFFGHCLQFSEMRVCRVTAGQMHQRRWIHKARQCINVGIRIVALEIAMTEPQHSRDTQRLLQSFLYFRFTQVWIAIRI